MTSWWVEIAIVKNPAQVGIVCRSSWQVAYHKLIQTDANSAITRACQPTNWVQKDVCKSQDRGPTWNMLSPIAAHFGLCASYSFLQSTIPSFLAIKLLLVVISSCSRYWLTQFYGANQGQLPFGWWMLRCTLVWAMMERKGLSQSNVACFGLRNRDR